MAPVRRSSSRGRGRLRILLIAALVAGLHVGVIVTLLAKPVRIDVLRETPAMEVIYLPRTSMPVSVVPEATIRDVPRAVHGKPRALELLRNPASEAPSAKNPPTENPPAVDWMGEIEGQAARARRSRAPPFKDFGFPRSAEPPSSRAPEFAWDHARTHRVETPPGGGIGINLNDNCVLLLFPFPFVACAVGKKPANGDLFKDMNVPRD